MTVRDICCVAKDIYKVYYVSVYYKDTNKFGIEYLGKFSDIKNSIMDCKIHHIYSECDWGISIEIMFNNTLHTNAKIIKHPGKYLNSFNDGCGYVSLSYLVRENADVNYIYYGSTWPEIYINDEYITLYKEFMEELHSYEKNILNSKHGKIIIAFSYTYFFINIDKEVNEDAKILKDYMLSNGWVFDAKHWNVYKIIVL